MSVETVNATCQNMRVVAEWFSIQPQSGLKISRGKSEKLLSELQLTRMVRMFNLSEVLKSLLPRDEEELNTLQTVIESLQSLNRARRGDLIGSIPSEAHKYLHGLIEALEIYQHIYGHALTVSSLSLSGKAVHELRQIRDMCLEEGPRSLY